MEEFLLSEAYSGRELLLFNKENMKNKKVNMEDELEKSIIYILNYCKEHGVFAYNDYMDRHFDNLLVEVMKVYYSIDPEFNEDPQDLIN